MKAQILKIAGVKSEKEFYKKFPTEESFMKIHGKALKKAQVGAMIQGSTAPQFNPQPMNFQQLYDQNDMFVTGSTQDMRNKQAMDLASYEEKTGGKQSGFTDALTQLGNAIGSASKGAGAKNGKKLKKAAGGAILGGISKGIDKAGGPAVFAQNVGNIVGGIQQMKDEKNIMKEAQQMAGVSDVALQASMTRPEQVQRRYVRPEDNVNTGSEFFPIYGTGTVLAKNGTEIANTFAPNTIYTDLEQAQFGKDFLTKFGNEGGFDAASKLTVGIGNPKGYGPSGASKLGGGVGSTVGNVFFGPLGGMVGKFAGEKIGDLLDKKAEKTQQARDVTDRNITSMAFNQGVQGLQQQNYSHVRDGGMINPQMINQFGNYKLSQLLQPDPTMDTLRAGGHLKNYTPPSERAMYTGREQFAMGGDLETHWGGYAEPMSYNPYLPDGGETVMFRGKSHDESDGQGNTGIGITYGDSPVEVERGEPAVQLKNGTDGDSSLTVYGNLQIPSFGASLMGDDKAKGKKFKHYVADLSKTEQKQNKIVEKSTEKLDNLEVITPQDLLSFESYKANILGANMKLKDIAKKKQDLASLQAAINDTAEEYGFEADALAKGKIKQAKKGASIKKAQTGVTEEGKMYEGSLLPEVTVTPYDEQFPFYQSLSNEQKKYINDKGPIGRATRALATTGKRGQTAKDISSLVKDVEKFGYEATGVPGTIRFAEDPLQNLTGTGKTLLDLGLMAPGYANPLAPITGPAMYGALGGMNPITGEQLFDQQNLQGAFNTLDAVGIGSMMAAPLIQPGKQAVMGGLKAVAPHMISLSNIADQTKDAMRIVNEVKKLEKAAMADVPVMQGVDKVTDVRNFGRSVKDLESNIRGATSAELAKYSDEYNKLLAKAKEIQSAGVSQSYMTTLNDIGRKLTDLSGYKHDEFIQKLKDVGIDAQTVKVLEGNPDLAAQYANRTAGFDDTSWNYELNSERTLNQVRDDIYNPPSKSSYFSPYERPIDRDVIAIDPVDGSVTRKPDAYSTLYQKDGMIYKDMRGQMEDQFYSYPFYKNVGDKIVDMYAGARLRNSPVLAQYEPGMYSTELLPSLFADRNNVSGMLKQALQHVDQKNTGLFYPASSLSGDSYPLSLRTMSSLLKNDPNSKLRFLGYENSNKMGFADQMNNPQLLQSELAGYLKDLEKVSGKSLPKPIYPSKSSNQYQPVVFPTFGVSKGGHSALIDDYLKNAKVSDRLGLKRSVEMRGTNELKNGGFVDIEKAQTGTTNLPQVTVNALPIVPKRDPFGPVKVPQSVIDAGIKKPRQTLAQMSSWQPTLGKLPEIRPFYSPFYRPGADQQTESEEGKIDWMTLANQIIPYLRPSNAQPLDPRQLAGEMLALATNQVEPVQVQTIQPQLNVPFDISLQEIINENEADYRATQRMVGYNPAALAALNAEKYAANQKVLGEQFKLNQVMKDKVYAENRDLLNQANLNNLQAFDQQYSRQQEALSNTKATSQAALSSIASKYMQNQLENRTLQTYENLYNYRFDPRFRANNMNTLAMFDTMMNDLTPAEQKALSEKLALASAKATGASSTTTNTTTIRNGGIVRATK
jgi:hypothetical protein